jgi:ligand-binding sensor domain-containing protein/putative methionine-R-sulfoxide reductase with GAF domain
MSTTTLRSIALLAIFIPAMGGRLMAQIPDENNFIRYTWLEGLSNNFVSGITSDSTGYIWVASHKGLDRFDGKTFLPFFRDSSGISSSLPDNYVVSMQRQSPNEIIGTTRAGAFTLNPATGHYQPFIVPCDSLIYFWTNHGMHIVKDRQGNYIVSTKTGLYVFNAKGNLKSRYDHFVPADAGRRELVYGGWLQSSPDGTTLQQGLDQLLGGRYDPGADRIDTSYIMDRQERKNRFTDSLGLPRPTWPGNKGEIFALNEYGNSIDVGDLHSPATRYNPMPFPVDAELGWYSQLDYINDSLICITCRTTGFYLLHYNARTKELSCDGRKYFKGIFCTTVYKDQSGRLWIGTAEGLFKQNLRSTFFSMTDLSLQVPSLQEHAVRSIYADSTTVFLGLLRDGGLLLLEKGTGKVIRQIAFSQPAFGGTIANIFPYDRDTLWLGTTTGILWFCKRNYHYGRVKMPSALDWTQHTNTIAFFRDSRKDIWISLGRLNSLIRYNRATRSFSDLSPPAFPLLKITYVFSIAEDLQGNIWLAGDGLCRWNIRKQRVDTLIPYPSVSLLRRNYMFILDRDDQDNLWMSSYGSEIIEFNCTSYRMQLRQGMNNLIDGNTVTASPIIDHHIWMGTDNGITALNVSDNSIKQFTFVEGLPPTHITSARKESFYDSLTHRFYIAAMYRLISFTPDVSLARRSPPALFIEKITTHNAPVVPDGNGLQLSWSQNTVAIAFNTINFTDPEENRFAWRMPAGRDTAWNDLNTQNGITLSNLPGGSHTVQIKLYSANNHWPQQIETLRINVRPPFWETDWFSLLLAIFVTAAIMLVYTTRLTAVRKKERTKALEQIISYFSSSLTARTNIEDVLWDVTQNLVSRLGYVDCIIYLWNADKTRMIQKAAYGPKGSPAAISSQAFEVEPGQGVVGHAMLTRKTVVVPDTRKDSRYRVDDVPRLSEISVPILHNDELLGIIDSEHPAAGYFGDRDVKILTTIATLVGNMIKQIESDRSLKIHQQEITLINQQLAEAQLSALQTQMNPHFIFNCLNSIKAMILSDERGKASRYLSKFANMIRITLNQSKEIFTTLYENIEHLENYLEMEKLRLEDTVSFQIVVDDGIDSEETLIPTLMIQPLVENAIWHGLMHKTGDKHLRVRFYRTDDKMCCSIEDNGIGITLSEKIRKLGNPGHKSVGLSNLRNRIKIMNDKYDTGCTLEIRDLREPDSDRTGTRAVLRFKTIKHKLYL